MTTEKMTVFAIVTDRHRERGIPGSCLSCPVALAIKDAIQTALGRPVAVIVETRAVIVFVDTRSLDRPAFSMTVPLAPEILKFIRAVDGGRLRKMLPRHPVIPIEIPDDLPPPLRIMVT